MLKLQCSKPLLLAYSVLTWSYLGEVMVLDPQSTGMKAKIAVSFFEIGLNIFMYESYFQ